MSENWKKKLYREAIAAAKNWKQILVQYIKIYKQTSDYIYEHNNKENVYTIIIYLAVTEN